MKQTKQDLVCAFHEDLEKDIVFVLRRLDKLATQLNWLTLIMVAVSLLTGIDIALKVIPGLI